MQNGNRMRPNSINLFYFDSASNYTKRKLFFRDDLLSDAEDVVVEVHLEGSYTPEEALGAAMYHLKSAGRKYDAKP